MKITFCPTNQYLTSFGAKSPAIRQADDIQRKTRTAFPFFSPCYADLYYRSCSPVYTAKTSADYLKHWDNVDRLERKIASLNVIRDSIQEALCGRYTFSNKVFQIIEDIQKYKLANCEEASTLTMASLIANGYTNTHKCSLKLDTVIFDKTTGEEKFRLRDNLDHAFVISTMDKDSSKKKDFIVVDSWYGFADSLSGAKARYFQLSDKQKIFKAKQKAINQFKQKYKSKYEASGKTFDLNNFDIRQNINYEIKESSSAQESEKLKDFYEKNYPDLILNSKSKSKD